MRVRLLPQGDPTLMTHELTRMGHPTPSDSVVHHTQPFACKITSIPPDLAIGVINWLQRNAHRSWWYQTPGETDGTTDLMLRSTHALLISLQTETQHYPDLHPLATVLRQALQRQQEAPGYLNLGRTSINLSQRTLVMGILNVTPDSFSDGGLYFQPDQAIKHAEEMLDQGADIIDVGGASSRPGATPVSAAVERERVAPVVRQIVSRFGAHVSVDTYRSSVARAALDAGAVMINDISALRFDADMLPLLANSEGSGGPHAYARYAADDATVADLSPRD